MDNKKKRIIIMSILNLLIIVVGVTFAYFAYSKTSSSQKLLAGKIYMKYNGQPEVTINNMVPSNTEPTSFFQFTVEGENLSTDTIKYDISVVRGDLPNDKTESLRIADRFLRFTLKRSEDGTNFTDVITNQSYSDLLNGARLYVGNIGTTSSKVTYTYRLYAWIGDEVVIYGGRAGVGDYPDTEWPNMFATVKVRVTGDFVNKAINNNLATQIKSKVNEDYVATYSGNSNDTYNNRGSETIYYFTGNDAKANSNVLFAGYCWQIIRTTDNGGVKLLYNGIAENNQCKTDRTIKKGINGEGNKTIDNLDTTTTYGTGFTYTENGFRLTGIVTNKTWSTDYNDLIGMYTCKGNNVSCTTISQIVRYESNTSAKGATYTIGTLGDKYTIGTSPFNGSYESPAYVGYMYNKAYIWKEGVKENVYYGNDVSYANGTYTLAGTTPTTVSKPDTTYHYVCDNTDTTTCSKVRYYITLDTNNIYRYIVLEKGETVEDAIYNMVNYKTNQNVDANINVYNSSIKAYLESWYSQNLSSYSASIDTTTTYCNERTVTSLGGWNKNGSLGNWLYFINSSIK